MSTVSSPPVPGGSASSRLPNEASRLEGTEGRARGEQITGTSAASTWTTAGSELKSDYDRALEELEAEGIITEVSSDADDACPVFYLPHLPVVRQSSVTTRVRPVFDASAKGPNLVSLNDCLETGPCLLPDLVEVLFEVQTLEVRSVC